MSEKYLRRKPKVYDVDNFANESFEVLLQYKKEVVEDIIFLLCRRPKWYQFLYKRYIRKEFLKQSNLESIINYHLKIKKPEGAMLLL